MAPETITAVGLSPDIVAFIRLLARYKVRYLIVGGEAVIFHGYPRFTGDVDFFYERTTANADRLFRALSDFWGNDVPAVKTASDLLDPGMIIQFGRPPNRIDLHNQIDGVSFGLAWASRVPTRLKTRATSVRLFYIGIDPLRRNKRATGRAKDLDDLEHLTVPGRKQNRTRKPRSST